MRHLHVRGAMNCATMSQFFVNDRRLFRNGIRIDIPKLRLSAKNFTPLSKKFKGLTRDSSCDKFVEIYLLVYRKIFP